MRRPLRVEGPGVPEEVLCRPGANINREAKFRVPHGYEAPEET